MASRVIADFKSAVMELLDLLPGHEVLLVLGKTKPLGDEESRPEPMLLEQRSDEGCVAGDRIVEGQNDGTRLLLLCHTEGNDGHEREQNTKQEGVELVIEIHVSMSSHGQVIEARPISPKQSNSWSVDGQAQRKITRHQGRV